MKTERNNKDMALRRAVEIIEEESCVKLPSNFAYTTMRRIEAERRQKAHRNRIVTLLSMSAMTVVGIVAVALFCGKEIVRAFLEAFHGQSSYSWIVPMLVCLVFFVVLDSVLRKRFLRDY